ncbi:MAG TPA: phage baseplate assembly protein V [Actinophytocola sp.]|uniref:phage baseplate assembly protein V n=1 Tax=Actinophytocola sp. TaxID=1872138 RepID=UPI002DDCD021|nr:phage baseplate assembly protein V [Actinophytocola sp.]HEV2779749.1 phage baseplate assembly protein V [Actinophytocola sp.]
MLGGLMGGSSTAIVWPTVKVGYPIGMPLSPTIAPNLVRAVVDTHLHLPDMFELTFHDEEGTVISDAGLEIGMVVEIAAGRADEDSTTSLITGEVTAIEAVCAEGLIYSVVRGYEKAHRLQRAKRTRTFVNMKDSDIAKQVAGDAGLKIGTVEETKATHTHIAQVSQTDWEFLTQRAREIGYETGVAGGKFFFRKASGRKDGGGGLGGLAGAVVDAAASMLGLGSSKLTFKDNLLTFLPRISAANITPDVEVRVWDPKAARVAVAKTDAATGTATIDGQEPKKLANSFTDGFKLPLPSLPALPPIPGLPKIDFGLAASNTAYLVVDRPLAVGSAADNAAEEAAKGLADHISSSFAEAEGDALGDPKIQAGAEVEIAGVPEHFAGKWVVTNARHVFDPEERGYHTRFWVSGRQNRSLLGLTDSGGAGPSATINGLVCGVITNCKDPDKKGRVKVALPWLSPNYESDWARVAHPGAGRRSGTLFPPEVGDEVLIGFEFGDPRRPYVLGGLLNDNTDFGHMSSAVDGSGAVVQRGLASPAGNRLLFTDDLPPGPPGSLPPNKSEIVLGTKDDKLSLVIDQVGGKVTLTCNPAPPVSKSPNGTLTIECPGLGAISIKAGTGGLKLETDGQLELTGKMGVKIESPAITQVKGQMLKLN